MPIPEKIKTICSDKAVVIAMEVILLIALSLSLLAWLCFYLESSKHSSPASGGRAPAGVAFLLTLYGGTTLFYNLVIQVSDTFKGHKAIVIIFNYVALTYMFLLNTWFKETFVFPLIKLIANYKLN